MAKLIEFRVPPNFQRKGRLIPQNERGKIIEFPLSPARQSLTAEGPLCAALSADAQCHASLSNAQGVALNRWTGCLDDAFIWAHRFLNNRSGWLRPFITGESRIGVRKTFQKIQLLYANAKS